MTPRPLAVRLVVMLPCGGIDPIGRGQCTDFHRSARRKEAGQRARPRPASWREGFVVFRARLVYPLDRFVGLLRVADYHDRRVWHFRHPPSAYVPTGLAAHF